MTLKNKEDVIENLGINDCPIHQSEGSFNLRITPTNPFAFLNEIPNYVVENTETGKIDFASDSLVLCNHFMSMYGTDGKETGLASTLAGNSNGPSEPTLN